MDGAGQQHDNALDDEGEYLSDVMGHYATPGESPFRYFIIFSLLRESLDSELTQRLNFVCGCYCRRRQPRRPAPKLDQQERK